jgi:RsiW-degrading membrane proteinase PrsW (M82 family)
MSNSESGATFGASASDALPTDPESAEGAFRWEPTSTFDRLLLSVYTAVRDNLRYVAVAAVALVVATNISVAVAGLFLSPLVGIFTFVSLIPALLVAVYVWESNPLDRTFSLGVAAAYVLGVLFCGLAYVLNTAAQPYFAALPVGTALFFFLFVGPVEETVKLAAAYLSGYDSRLFRGAIDGAAYGAFAALGFVTAENALYIVGDGIFTASPFVGTLIARAGIGPAHVIWSAVAGYYLGLAKTTPDYTGPVVMKGIVIAAVLHATYNTFVTYRGALAESVGALSSASAETAMYGIFLLTFYAGIWLLLERLVRRYRRAYAEHGLPAPDEAEAPSTPEDPDSPSPLASTAVGSVVSLLSR